MLDKETFQMNQNRNTRVSNLRIKDLNQIPYIISIYHRSIFFKGNQILCFREEDSFSEGGFFEGGCLLEEIRCKTVEFCFFGFIKPTKINL